MQASLDERMRKAEADLACYPDWVRSALAFRGGDAPIATDPPREPASPPASTANPSGDFR